MKIEDIDKRLLEIFKDHKAKLTKVNDRLSILDFARPNTNAYRMRVIFDGAYVIITGDIGIFTYWCTWNVELGDFYRGKTNLGYFFGKLKTEEMYGNSSNGYGFSSSVAIDQIKSLFDDDSDYYDLIRPLNDCKEEIEECKKNIKSLEAMVNKDDFEFEELENERIALKEFEVSLIEIQEEIEDDSKHKIYLKLIEEAEGCSSLYDWNRVVDNMAYEIDKEFEYLTHYLYDLGKDICPRIKMHYTGLVLAAEQLCKDE